MWSRLMKHVEAMTSAAAVRHDTARTNAYVGERVRNSLLISGSAERPAATGERPGEAAPPLPAAAS